MLKPAVVRSMCTRRVKPFGGEPRHKERKEDHGVCPRFDVAFLRNLQILSRDKVKYACTQEQLEAHPCKGKPVHECRKHFVASLV